MVVWCCVVLRKKEKRIRIVSRGVGNAGAGAGQGHENSGSGEVLWNSEVFVGRSCGCEVVVVDVSSEVKWCCGKWNWMLLIVW